MKLAKGLLYASALLLIVIGLGFLLLPVQWAAAVEIGVPTPTARTDLRATYGGFDIGVGVFLALCARRAEWIRPGLVAIALVGAGYGGGRLFGILAEGTASTPMLVFLGLEAVLVALAVHALRQLPRSNPM
jgi:uncharacterized protein YjeT (DUF2065 family)